MSEKGSVILLPSGGVLPNDAPPEDAGRQMGEPSAEEAEARRVADEASAGAGLTTKVTKGARPGGTGVRTEGQAQPSASVAVRGVRPVVEVELPGAGAPEADDEKWPGDLKK